MQDRQFTVTEDVKDFILSCFKEDKEHGLKKQKHTAKRIYDRLVEEKGFVGAESTIRKVVKELKDSQNVPPQALVPNRESTLGLPYLR
ncbi:hypothetical protein [Proteiniborus sp. MB09-C3]|uniref:hypothetical protein n=1 Tax=Proteiniborus sp. MB09-C3 TaxID=3050072 RepID=UPI0033329D15